MMSPKVVDKEARKREIAQAALQVFARRGFEAASMSEVAKAAGIGKGTVYEYFDTKEDLMFGTLVEWMRSFDDMELAPSSTIDPRERLRQYAHRVIATFLDTPEPMQLFVGLMQLILTNRSFFERYPVLREMSSGQRRVIVDILLEGVSQGVFRASIARDAEIVAINLLAFLDGIGLHYAIGSNFLDLRAQVDYYVDTLLESLEEREKGE